jgi:hypothetical protein
LRDPPAADALVALAALVAGAGYALRWEVSGRGGGMWAGYPVAFVIQLFFGLIALWAARQIAPRAGAAERGSLAWSALRVAAILAAIDAVTIVARDMTIGRVAAPALASLMLAALLFRREGLAAGLIGAMVFIMKLGLSLVLAETVYLIFTPPST